MNPGYYYYFYFYISTWVYGDFSSCSFYFSNYQITQLSIYLLAADMTNVKFISILPSWYHWDYNFYYSYGTRQSVMNVNINPPNTQGYTVISLKAFTFLTQLSCSCYDNIVYRVSSTVLDSQTVQITSYT
jgi:hypothetical protein